MPSKNCSKPGLSTNIEKAPHYNGVYITSGKKWLDFLEKYGEKIILEAEQYTTDTTKKAPPPAERSVSPVGEGSTEKSNISDKESDIEPSSPLGKGKKSVITSDRKRTMVLSEDEESSDEEKKKKKSTTTKNRKNTTAANKTKGKK